MKWPRFNWHRIIGGLIGYLIAVGILYGLAELAMWAEGWR